MRRASALVVLVAVVALGWRVGRAPAARRQPHRARARRLHPVPRRPQAVLPGEYEPVEDLLLAWDDYLDEFLVEVAAAAWTEVPITFVLGDDQDPRVVKDALDRAGLDPTRVRILQTPIDSLWMRDFGPLVVRGRGGRRTIVDFTYFAGDNDDLVPEELHFALWPEWDYEKVDVEIEGGNILSDGTGRCITAEREPREGESVPAMADIASALRESLGCRHLVVVPPIAGEPTGHADMFIHITGPGRALVGRYRSADDPENAARLDRAARILRKNGFRVRRIPMPDHEDGHFRTYTNAIAVNGVVLVPVYPEDTDGEPAALRAFQAAYPHRRVVAIVATDIIDLAGAIHCATMTVAR